MTTAVQSAPTTEFAIGFREMMVPQLEKEIATTKRVLAAIPDDKSSWKPEPNSRCAAELAKHIASVDVAFLEGIAAGSFAKMMDSEQAGTSTKGLPAAHKELANWYEKNANAALGKIRKMSGEQLTKVIDFYGAFQLPAFAYLLFVNNHSIHHRGQLAAYLRPMGAKVPNIYGGSFDEPWQG